jgi:hypothetical protein
MHFSAVSSKVNSEIVNKSVISCLFQSKNHTSHNGGNSGNTTGGNYRSCCKPGHVRQNCFKVKKKETGYSYNQAGNNNKSKSDREYYDSQDLVFAATSINERFTDDIWICDSGACEHYCTSSKGLFNVREIKQCITVGNGKSMLATEVGSLKCQDIQLDGSGLDITLREVKLAPKLWINLFSINKSLENDHHLSNQGLSICLSKGSVSVTFDRVIRTTNDSV